STPGLELFVRRGILKQFFRRYSIHRIDASLCHALKYSPHKFSVSLFLSESCWQSINVRARLEFELLDPLRPLWVRGETAQPRQIAEFFASIPARSNPAT